MTNATAIADQAAAPPPCRPDRSWRRWIAPASVAALAWSCAATFRLAGWRVRWPAIAAAVAIGLTLEPMYHTLYLGQINLILMALVLGDVWLIARGRNAGAGVGIAAAIKLTPAI